jgi:hypothetical protein
LQHTFLNNKKNNKMALLKFLCNCSAESFSVTSSCNSIAFSKPIRKPNLAIYSQYDEFTNGRSPTWDNPDIISNSWGPFKLLPETIVKVRNISDVNASNAIINFSISPFGIGHTRTLIATRIISLLAGQEVELQFPLPLSLLEDGKDQRIGIFIEIDHPYDANKINNFGIQIHEGNYTTEIGRASDMVFPVFNNSPLSKNIILSVLPTEIESVVKFANGSDRHMFSGLEQMSGTLRMNIPASLVGSSSSIINKSVTVIAKTDTGELIGGITKLLRINN